ncbi:PilN domain-containing protein [Candidatus Daviesbacteria bacterium]|nr:PilN domain-containing protein [Candidatus Daviesbacteria bacterium]
MDKAHSPFFKVNLLIRKEEQIKLHIRLLKWLLSSGRFIVIAVELITIGAFIYRYKLDTNLLDLQEKIEAQIPYIESMKTDEITIRQLQFQLATIKQIRQESPGFTQAILRISQLTPKSVKLTGISLDRTQTFPKTIFRISGQTGSNLEISAFMKALQKDPAFAEVTLTNISFEERTTFTITGSLTGQGVQSS